MTSVLTINDNKSIIHINTRILVCVGRYLVGGLNGVVKYDLAAPLLAHLVHNKDKRGGGGCSQLEGLSA